MSAQDIFSENVRKFRKAKGFTQEGLGEATGLHRTYIGGIEQRRINPSLKNIELIAKALGIEPAFLFISSGSDVIADGLKSTPQKARHRSASPKLNYADDSSEDHYALCIWTEDDIVFLPFDMGNAALSAQVANLYRRRGLSGNDLAEACLSAQEGFRTYLNEL